MSYLRREDIILREISDIIILSLVVTYNPRLLCGVSENVMSPGIMFNVAVLLERVVGSIGWISVEYSVEYALLYLLGIVLYL